MTFCKYSFPSKEIWNTLKSTINNIEGEIVDFSFFELGNICLEKDIEGNCISFDSKYAVDIMWNNEPFQEFNEFEVFPDPVGIHTFYGCESLYLARFCQFNPESPFCSSN